MNTRARAKAAEQFGLLTRRDALDAGMTPSLITAAIRSGDLVVVRRGVYALGDVWAELDEYRGRHRLRSRAATLVMHRGWVLSHDSSADEHDLQLLRPAEPHVHITRPGFTSAWTRYGVKHHYARYRPSQVTEVEGVAVLDMARTVADVAREHGEQAGVVTADSAMRHGVSRTQLLEAVAPMDQWPYSTFARNAIDLADPRAENANESLGRLLVMELGIGDPDPQFPVRTEEGIKWCDIRVGNHLFECDGRIKFLPPERGGVASRPVEDILWDEKKRERLVSARMLGVSRIVYADYWGDNRAAAIKRLKAEYAISEARFGAELDPRLAREAAEIRARFGWRDRVEIDRSA
jgi:Transcriptional regulator, AbiEi antitoxin